MWLAGMKKELLDAMFIPRDAVYKEYNLSTVGNKQLFVEGFEAIKELSSTLIRLRVKDGFLCITGEKLYVEYFGDGEIMIRGCITAIQLK